MKKLIIAISSLAFICFSQSSLAALTCGSWITSQGGTCTAYFSPRDPVYVLEIDATSAYQFCKYHGHSFDDDLEYSFPSGTPYAQATSNYDFSLWVRKISDGSTPIVDAVMCVDLTL